MCLNFSLWGVPLSSPGALNAHFNYWGLAVLSKLSEIVQSAEESSVCIRLIGHKPRPSRHDETSKHMERQINTCFILPLIWNHVIRCISCALVHYSKAVIYSLHMTIWIWVIHRATLMKICHHPAGLWIWHLLETEPCDILWYRFLLLGTNMKESADRKSVSQLVVNHEVILLITGEG